MSIRIGIKVWSNNAGYIPHVKKLYKNGHCDYAEIYVGMKATDEETRRWQDLGEMPVALHAPHSDGGFNPADSKGIEEKLEALRRVEKFQQLLKPLYIIFHPGINGPLEESIRQFHLFKKQFPEIFKKALMENKPHLGIEDGVICRGDTPQEVLEIMRAIDLGFCLDFGHAAGYAVWAQKSWQEVIEGFMKLTPKVFHFCDGDIKSPRDIHRHLGGGNFPLKEMLETLPDGAYLTLETPHDSKDNLDDFPKDAQTARSLAP